MRYLIIALLFVSISAFGQKNRYKAPGTAYTTDTPNFVPVRGTEGEVAIDSLTGQWWQYSYQENAWKHLGYWVTETGTSGSPAYTPNKVTSPLAINNGDSLYHYRGGIWRLVSGGGGGGIADGDYGDIDVTSGGTVWTVDTSAITMIKIAQSGAVAGQVIKWNGTQWAPADDTGTVSTGGGIYGPSDTVTYQHTAVVDSGLTFSSAEDTAYLNILMAPGTFGTGAYFNADSIRLRKYDLAGSNEIRLNTSGITLLTTSPDRVTIQGTDSRYAADYRATYNDRSLIDKGYADDTYLQTIDTFTISNDTLYLSLARDSIPASFVVLPDLGTDTSGYNLDFRISGDTLYIADGDGELSVDLSPYLDNTDAQTLSVDSTDVGGVIERFAISISGGNTIYLDVPQVSGSGAGQNNVGANLGSGVGVYAGKVDTILQFKSLVEGYGVDISATSTEITIAADTAQLATVNDINIVQADIDAHELADGDLSSTNEIQQIDTFDINANTLRISLSSDNVPFKSVDLAQYLDNTDTSGYNISLSISNDTLSLEDGDGVLSVVLPTAANIYNSDGNILAEVERNVNLDTFTYLRFNYPNGNLAMEIFGGEDSTAVDGSIQILSPDVQTGFSVTNNGAYMSKSGANQSQIGATQLGLYVQIQSDNGDPGQLLKSDGDYLYWADDLDTSGYNIALTISNDTLFLEDGNGVLSVELPPSTDAQTLSIDSTTVGNIERFAVSISNGNTVRFDVNQDQTVVLNEGYGINNSGTYPNFTIAADTTELATVNDINIVQAADDIPLNQIAYGTGTGITSNYSLKVDQTSWGGGSSKILATGSGMTADSINLTTSYGFSTSSFTSTSLPFLAFYGYRSAGTGDIYAHIHNDAASSSGSDAYIFLETESTGGDAFVYYRVGSVNVSEGVDNSDNDLFKIDYGSSSLSGTYAIGIGSGDIVGVGGAPVTGRALAVTGEVRISDLTSDTPTRVVGADADGDLSAIPLGSGLSITAGTLNTTGVTLTDGDKGDIDVTSSGTVWTVDTSAITLIKMAENSVDSTKIATGAISVTDIGQHGASSGQVLKWNGTQWMPDTDNSTTDTNIYNTDGNVKDGGTTIDVSGNDGLYFLLDNAGGETNSIIRMAADYAADDAFTYWLSATTGSDSLKLYSFDDGLYMNWEGITGTGAGFTISSNTIMNLTADSILVQTLPTRTTLPFMIGLQGNTLSKIEGTADGQVLVWDETNGGFWEIGTSSGGVSDGDYGDIDVTSGGTVWTVDTSAITSLKILDGTIANADLASGVGGIYKGSGTIPNGTVSTLSSLGNFIFDYNSSDPALSITDNLGVEIYSPDGSGFLTAYNSTLQIGAGTGRQITINNTEISIQHDHVVIDGRTAANPGIIRFMEPNGANYFSIQAQAMSADYVYVWPVDDGTPNQVLQTDGSGNLSWTTPSGGIADADYGDITVSSSGTVWNIDAGVVGNTELASGVGGIYKGDGTLAAGTTNALLPASGIFRLEYDGTNAGLIVDDLNSASTIFSKDGTQYFSADNTQSIIGSGTSKMEYIDGVLRVYDSDATQYVAIQTPATGSLTANYTLTLPVDDGTPDQLLKTDGSGNLSWTTVAGGGDILNGGNTTGATVVIGTNDANALSLETNNVERLSITGGASTGGAFTFTNVTANTNTVQDVFTVRSNSTGTAAANFGPGLLFQGESSTTDNRDMARISTEWINATDASRSSALDFYRFNGGAFAKQMRLDNSISGDGTLVIGTTPNVSIAGGQINTSSAYSIFPGGTFTINSTGSGNIVIATTQNNASSTSNIILGNGTSFTQTSGTRNYIQNNAGFAPTSGTAVHNQLAFTGTFNQTGGANGITRGIYLNQTLTAVADFRGIEIAYSNSAAKGIYQSGASTTNNFVGNTAFGTTSAPNASAMIDMVSTSKGFGAPVMTTAQRDAISSPREGLVVYSSDNDALNLRDGASVWKRISTVQTVLKTADETVNNSTTYQADDNLTFTAKANKKYVVKYHLRCNDTDFNVLTGSMKAKVVATGATTVKYWSDSYEVLAQTGVAADSDGGADFSIYDRAGLSSQYIPVVIYAYIDPGASDRTVNLEWAQANASSRNSKILTGSFLEYEEIN